MEDIQLTAIDIVLKPFLRNKREDPHFQRQIAELLDQRCAGLSEQEAQALRKAIKDLISD